MLKVSIGHLSTIVSKGVNQTVYTLRV